MISRDYFMIVDYWFAVFARVLTIACSRCDVMFDDCSVSHLLVDDFLSRGHSILGNVGCSSELAWL